MRKLLKAALLATLGLIGVTAVHATTYYVEGHLILGFTTGGGTDVLYDLGAASSLTNGKTWNLTTNLTGRTLAVQYWGVIGNNSAGSPYKTNWVTTAVGATPNSSSGPLFNKMDQAMISLCQGTTTANFPTYPIFAGESGSDAASDANSWYSQVAGNIGGGGTGSGTAPTYYNTTANDPTVLGTNNAYFWSELTDNATMTLLGVFTLDAKTNLTYNTLFAGFTGTPTTGSAPLQVVFSDASVGSGVGTNWVWNFGDGHSITNTTSANVTNTYVVAGTNTVTLIVTAAGVASTNQQIAYVVVTNAAVTAPVASFQATTPTNGFAPLTVGFTNTSTGSFTNSVWNFGNGTIITNLTGGNVTNTYAVAGTNTVTLTVKGAGGSSTNILTNYIVVTNAAVAAPVASFQATTPTNGFAPLTVGFTNTSAGSFTNSVWNFGNGTIVTNLTGGNVTNTYAAVGTNTVILVVNGSGGSSTNKLVNYIAALPAPNLVATNLSTANGKLVFSCPNSPAGVQYRILSTTNLTLPVASWTPVFTNTFPNPYTNSSLTNAGAFFRLVSP